MIKTHWKHIGFHYLLIKIQLHTLILLKLNTYIPQEVLNKIKNKSIILLLLDYTDLFSLNDYKKNAKIISILKISTVEEPRVEFRLRKIDETRNHLLHEKNFKDLMSEKDMKTCKYLNYVEQLLVLASTVFGCISISAFASLVAIPVGFTSSVVGINICAITSAIKNYKSIIKKKKKNHAKIALPGKD